MPRLEINVPEVQDPVAKENFNRVREYIQEDVFDRFEGKHFEIDLGGAVTNWTYPHHLGFQPKDIIQTSLTGAGALTWNYDSFTREYLNITTTAACTVRAFIGRYEEEYR